MNNFQMYLKNKGKKELILKSIRVTKKIWGGTMILKNITAHSDKSGFKLHMTSLPVLKMATAIALVSE